ncbi:hypothetical protein TrST_g10260 [Triparma strigata]|uniref:HMG box domain-containing protein n=1 Tax=Triparma strigata TaxID=1606541 RepID=A0A9W6ZT62_9STRA|nr:hypothetical protein TrST_g10260 [Triparma strigata]
MPSLVTTPAAPDAQADEEIIAVKATKDDTSIPLIPATSPSASSSTVKTPEDGKSKKKKENAVTNEKKKATKKADTETKPQPSLMKFFMGGEKKASKSFFSSNAKIPATKPKSSPKKAAPVAKTKKEVKPKQTPSSGKKEKKQKKEKDPNAPKKAKSAYIYFTGAKRVELKESEPELKQTEILKKCGELWKSISEDEKAVYVKMAEEDKVRYKNELAAYESKEKDVEDAMETAMEDAAADASMEIEEEEVQEEEKKEEKESDDMVTEPVETVEVVPKAKASPSKKELLKLKIAAKSAAKKTDEQSEVVDMEVEKLEEVEEVEEVKKAEKEPVESPKPQAETAAPPASSPKPQAETAAPPASSPKPQAETAAPPASMTTPKPPTSATTKTPDRDTAAFKEKKLKALNEHMGASSSLVEGFTIHVTKSSFEFVSPSGKKFRSMKAVAAHFEVAPPAAAAPKAQTDAPISSGTRGTPTPPKAVAPPVPVDTAKVETYTKKRASYLSILLTDPRASKRPEIAPEATSTTVTPPEATTENMEVDKIPMKLMAKFSTLVEGSTLTLDKLVESVVEQMADAILTPELVKAQILLLAEHKFYCEGEQGSVWEMKIADLIPSASLNKVVKHARAFRKKISFRARQTSKLLEVLQKNPGNAKKIADEEAKVSKFDVEDKEALQKQLEKEKEKQKKEEDKEKLAKVKEEAKMMKLKAKEEEKAAKDEAKAASLKAKEEEKAAKEKAKEEERLAKEAKLKKQQSALMGFFKKPAKKVEAVKTPPTLQAPAATKPTKSLLSEVNSCETHKPLGVKIKKFKGKGKLVSVSVMATVFPPGADPSNPFSRVTPYSEPRNMKLWNKKKFLMFDEDERPPYKGTWSKRSSVVTGRRPFGQDTKHLNYDYDSEAEWEEEEPGEDIDDEKAEEEDKSEELKEKEYDYNDGWMCEDHDLGDENENEMERELRKKEARDTDFQEKIIIGCIKGGQPLEFKSTDDSEAAKLMHNSGIRLLEIPGSPTAVVDLSPVCAKAGRAKSKSKVVSGATKFEKLLPAFLDFVHGSTIVSREKLVESYLSQQFEEGEKPSKKVVNDQIKEVAEKLKLEGGGSVWKVKDRELDASIKIAVAGATGGAGANASGGLKGFTVAGIVPNLSAAGAAPGVAEKKAEKEKVIKRTYEGIDFMALLKNKKAKTS